MHQAFARDDEERWLQEVAPTIFVRILYLARENNGIRSCIKNIFVKKA